MAGLGLSQSQRRGFGENRHPIDSLLVRNRFFDHLPVESWSIAQW